VRIYEQLSEALREEWNSTGVSMGYRYDGSNIVVADGSVAPVDDKSDYVPTARPGHRAPHAWMRDGRSTIDLFGGGLVLLRIGKTRADVGALAAAANERRVPLSVIDIEEAPIRALYERDLVLVRPDGHVAWRGDTLPADVAELVETVRGSKAPLQHA
jgi:hypothetical protein